MAVVAVHYIGDISINGCIGIVLYDNDYYKEGNQSGLIDHLLRFGDIFIVYNTFILFNKCVFVCVFILIYRIHLVEFGIIENSDFFTNKFCHCFFLFLFSFHPVVLTYMWACVVSLFQLISIVKSKKYRSLYGDNPLKSTHISTLINESSTRKSDVKLFPLHNLNKNTQQLQSSPNERNKYVKHPFSIGQTQRIRNKYMRMRRFYLNETTLGHG